MIGSEHPSYGGLSPEDTKYAANDVKRRNSSETSTQISNEKRRLISARLFIFWGLVGKLLSAIVVFMSS